MHAAVHCSSALCLFIVNFGLFGILAPKLCKGYILLKLKCNSIIILDTKCVNGGICLHKRKIYY